MRHKKRGKLLAVFLSAALLGTQMSGMAVAEGADGYTGGICEHHPEHTAECGYQEAVPEQPCRHEHTKECYEYVTNCVHVHTEECYPLIAVEVPAGAQDTGAAEDAGTAAETQTEWVRGPEPTACTHVCSEESGCVTKSLNCIHADTINADGSITYAVHDASCGYAPAVEGKECTFVCEICSALGNQEEETEVPEEENVGVHEEGTVGEQEDAAVTALQKRINELPDVETVKQMTSDEQNAVYNQAQNIADTYYDELTKEQQKQVDLTKLMGLMNYFNGQVSTMAAGYTLADGVLTITSSEGLDEIEFIGMKYGNSIKSIIIEKNVEGSIGNGAFYGRSSLTSVTVKGGAKITSIGEAAFRECGNLTSVTVEEGAKITSIGEGAFYRCSSLTSVTVEEGAEITSIGFNAFYGCSSLTEITIPDSVTSIGLGAFYGCSSLTEITIPGSVTSMDYSAFSGCSGLTKITILDGVTSIGLGAFYGCSSLTEITIPGSVTSIGESAFSGCSSLTEVTLPAIAPISVSEDAFYGQWGDINFIIPADSIGSGKGKYNLNESPWKQIKMVNGMRVDSGKFVIESVTINLSAPQAGGNLPSASSVTNGVSVSSSWNPNDTVAKRGITYTVTVTLSVQSENYKFANSVAVTFNNDKVEDEDITEDGTLTFTQTYQIPKQAQDSPVISIDYQNETLNTTAGMEYSVDDGGSWSDCSADMTVAALGWDGTEKTVQIRMKETADKYASESTEVTIPARPELTVSQMTGSTTASGLTVSASVSGIPAGVSPEVQYQLVADDGSIDNGKWQDSGEFTDLSAGTAYTAYAKCEATTGSFASISSGQTVRTAAAAYTVSIPSAALTAGDSTSTAEISVDTSKNFDLGYNGQVQVKVQSGGAVSSDGSLTLTRQGASNTITSAMLVNGTKFTDINKPVMTFTMDNYNPDTAKAAVSFAEPKTTDTTQTVIPAGTYSGTVTFEVTYSEQ